MHDLLEHGLDASITLDVGNRWVGRFGGVEKACKRHLDETVG